MNITTFKAPPDDFDPVTAPLKTLALHGIPRRPDPQAEPGLRALWDKAFARKPKFIVPKANPALVWKSAPHRVPKQKEFGLAGDWAGAVVQVASLGFTPPEPANMVYAEWVVPKIGTKPSESGSNRVGFWVGMGGYGTNNLLQAGTAATLSGSSVNYWAWTEWVPAGFATDSLSLTAGDTVSVLVCAPETDHGYVSMMNHRTNQAISVGVNDPSGTTPYDGSTVEWIVEAIDNEVPNFGNVIFKEISAGTQHHTINLAKAFALKATLGSTTLMTGKVLLSANEVEVIWDAAT
jgi:Peptidase A4 family